MDLFKFTPEDLIKEFGLKNTKIVGKNLMAECPRAREHEKGTDNHRSFGINLNDSSFHCFSCNFRGLSLRSLARQMGVELSNEMLLTSFTVKVKEKKSIPIVYESEFPVNPLGAHELLKHRGIDLEAILKTGVTVTDDNHLIFPCRDIYGNLMGWNERFEGWAGRYGAFPEGVEKRYLMFGYYAPDAPVFMVEGPVDALKLISWGYYAFATCGNRITDFHAEQVLQIASKVVLVPDMDNGGKVWWRDAMRVLKGKLPVTYIITEGYDDVGDVNLTHERFKEFKECRM